VHGLVNCEFVKIDRQLKQREISGRQKAPENRKTVGKELRWKIVSIVRDEIREGAKSGYSGRVSSVGSLMGRVDCVDRPAIYYTVDQVTLINSRP